MSIPIVLPISCAPNLPDGHRQTLQRFGYYVPDPQNPGKLRQVIATPVDYVRESIGSPTTLIQFFSMFDEASPVARFLGAIDLFVVWWIVVLAIGMSVLYRRSTRRLALVFTGAYVGLALLAALAMAVSGGTA